MPLGDVSIGSILTETDENLTRPNSLHNKTIVRLGRSHVGPVTARLSSRRLDLRS
jgi:hypothetical protein